jgi:hypothetical protein
MALTANLIPSQVVTFPCPYDATLAFAGPAAPQTLVATGYVNALNSGQLDLGGAKPQSAAGRTDFIWNMDITAVNMATGDEFYQFFLLGSNDVNFGNGNVDVMDFYDIAAAASGRIIPNLLGATPVIPPVGLGGMLVQSPASNLQCRIYYRYLRLRALMGGTGPSVTVAAWISRAGIHV